MKLHVTLNTDIKIIVNITKCFIFRAVQRTFSWTSK